MASAATRKRRVKRWQTNLLRLGWPLKPDGVKGDRTREAIKDFQRGFAFWRKPLVESGRLDARTKRAILYSLSRGGKVSRHFMWIEFQSKGNGWIRANRGFVRALEKYRRTFGATFLLSTYRDPAHNVKVGGAEFSQHTDITFQGRFYRGGNAGDIANKKATLSQVRALGVFSGIGVSADGLVRHVDCRHLGANTTGASPTNPTSWDYPT